MTIQQPIIKETLAPLELTTVDEFYAVVELLPKNLQWKQSLVIQSGEDEMRLVFNNPRHKADCDKKIKAFIRTASGPL